MFKTSQEELWASKFGEDYVARNPATPSFVADKTAMFARLLPKAGRIGSVLEFGANIGANILALRRLLPEAEYTAVEINPAAVEELRRIPALNVVHQSILDYAVARQYEFVLTCGVLIHMAPEHLAATYARIYDSSSRYICVAEYYNPRPVEVEYRGKAGLLFKRDFAGDLLDMYPSLRLLDYGFAYHRDLPQVDDLTWFVMEKA